MKDSRRVPLIVGDCDDDLASENDSDSEEDVSNNSHLTSDHHLESQSDKRNPEIRQFDNPEISSSIDIDHGVSTDNVHRSLSSQPLGSSSSDQRLYRAHRGSLWRSRRRPSTADHFLLKGKAESILNGWNMSEFLDKRKRLPFELTRSFSERQRERNRILSCVSGNNLSRGIINRSPTEQASDLCRRDCPRASSPDGRESQRFSVMRTMSDPLVEKFLDKNNHYLLSLPPDSLSAYGCSFVEPSAFYIARYLYSKWNYFHGYESPRHPDNYLNRRTFQTPPRRSEMMNNRSREGFRQEQEEERSSMIPPTVHDDSSMRLRRYLMTKGSDRSTPERRRRKKTNDNNNNNNNTRSVINGIPDEIYFREYLKTFTVHRQPLELSTYPIFSHSAVACNGQLYSFGGFSALGCTNLLTVLDLNLQAWKAVAVSCPCSIDYSDGSSLDGLSESGANRVAACSHHVPTPRYAHAMAAEKSRIYIFGGDASPGYLHDVWFVDTDTNMCRWQQITPPADDPRPEGRAGHSWTYNDKSDSLFLFGGWRGLGGFNDIWEFHLDTFRWECWKPHFTSSANSHTTMLYPDPPPKREGFKLLNQIISPTFHDNEKNHSRENNKDEQFDVIPFGRYWHVAFLHEDSLYVHGGVSVSGLHESLWKFSLKTRKWQLLLPHGQIPARRCRHAGSLVGDVFVMFGGRDAGCAARSDLWEYHLLSNTWIQIELLTSLSSRVSDIPLRRSHKNNDRDKDKGKDTEKHWDNDEGIFSPGSDGSGADSTLLCRLPAVHCHSFSYLSTCDSFVLLGGCDYRGNISESTVVLRRFSNIAQKLVGVVCLSPDDKSESESEKPSFDKLVKKLLTDEEPSFLFDSLLPFF